MKSRSGFGWLQLLAGILLVALGIFAFRDPALALKGVVIVCGLAEHIFILRGVFLDFLRYRI